MKTVRECLMKLPDGAGNRVIHYINSKISEPYAVTILRKHFKCTYAELLDKPVESVRGVAGNIPMCPARTQKDSDVAFCLDCMLLFHETIEGGNYWHKICAKAVDISDNSDDTNNII